MAFRKSTDNIIGQTVGTLKVLKEIEPRISNQKAKIYRVECQCVLCGKTIIKDLTEIRRGRTSHRGCSLKQIKTSRMTENVEGKVFASWKVLKEYRDSTSTRMCLCECQCGSNIIWEHRKYDLLAGRTKGCRVCAAKRAGEKNKSPNKYDLSQEYGIGYTDKNETFYFDLEDYDKIKDYHWYIDDSGYVHSQYHENGKMKHIKMHRLVMNVSNPTIIIDHVGHNTADNRKSMLRICTTKENAMNHKSLKNRSEITGVKKDGSSWLAYIGFNNEVKYLGSFKNQKDAIAARKAAEEKYFGEYSYDASMKIAERNKIKE